VPLHELRAMPAADLSLYRQYTQRHGSPIWRAEALLAQVALVLAQVNGNKEAKLADFLFEPNDPEAQAARRQRELDEFFND